jgi:hypothetical protein
MRLLRYTTLELVLQLLLDVRSEATVFQTLKLMNSSVVKSTG